MQFKLKTILIGVAATALLSGAIAPVVRRLAPEQQQWVGVQAAAIMAGVGFAFGLHVFSEMLRRRWMGNLLGSLYRPRIRFRSAVVPILGVLCSGFSVGTQFVVFTASTNNAPPDFWKTTLMCEVVFAAIGVQSLLELLEVSLVMRIHEGGVVVKRTPYVWDRLRYVCWNEGSGELSIAIGGKRVQAEVPVAERASISSLLERNCGAGVLTAVDPQSDQGRTLTNVRR